MSRILIPRSDSISVKIIEPSDFEKMFSSDILRDYRKSGFAITAGSGLAVNIAVGIARVKGLYVESNASESVASLTANSPNYIYITLARDSNSEAESWSFTKNTTGTTPADSFPLGTAPIVNVLCDLSVVDNTTFDKLNILNQNGCSRTISFTLNNSSSFVVLDKTPFSSIILSFVTSIIVNFVVKKRHIAITIPIPKNDNGMQTI